ncbi:2-oxoglutarate dehydrogenase E1 component [Neoehrlichia mikurensis]|uniref:2-oxoglutarate dehydrogenase E1 component n=1 Tax=Neoehrlichia mikurensis TaxID=89586 RepID=A0A9Q9BZ49_9RICK|nr:2-oxoglutarate dehydrogenase E1 component [Neoehrlichia mikurensis]QXK92101.1 2-oxoglutarate dehydrogenase E1 component [Neoehrlichia mikurensis]QXK92558.1 2-oxoglutarate dehydrogenase E1 component [Neoehrlichia mikurensis]QXK93794.1 2-oxoglutarate dehydrogenase E1 component [Neoehrlichia mikurensis]UTO55230.1 2-oxoglutarate dehydrogenase E1 component [Neoehrlichia mikurensis]UTO56150.1 2-oxoglutarate dehydrogenase E1 component [Neoehrlichia mikurensis]
MLNNEKDDLSYLFSDNLGFVEEIYQRYQQGDKSLSKNWQDSIELALQQDYDKKSTSKIVNTDDIIKKNKTVGSYYKILELLNFFRHYGHIAVNLDPLGISVKQDLNYSEHIDLSDIHMNDTFNGVLGLENPSLNDIINELRSIYCNKIGFEFMHIENHEERYWLQERIESLHKRLIAVEEKKKILQDLFEVEIFEQFLHVKHPGYKRFSIEGGDTLITALENIISLAPEFDISEIVLGMPHRGRLTVLTKVMQKPHIAVMYEFSGGFSYPSDLEVSGDVKYHMGYSCNRKLDNNRSIHLSLSSNPSHLESVNPVVMGRVRAKQDKNRDDNKSSIMAILMHGDASFIGQGVVAESCTLSRLPGYEIQGTIHIIVNNQVGFTTNPEDARSSRYCSDMAKVINVPIFHVNGDDPELVTLITSLAVEYRNKFKKDVVIDIVCYRRYGHNEGDEPMFTQPLMYSHIVKHKTVAKIYAEKLIDDCVVTSEDVILLQKNFRSKLDKDFDNIVNYVPQEADWFKGYWKNLYRPIPGNYDDDIFSPNTGVSKDELLLFAQALSNIPDGFQVNSKVLRLLSARFQAVKSGDDIDWGTGEILAYASLLVENFTIRLSGEDCQRGTFSHRHAVLVDQVTGEQYIPLNHLRIKQGSFEVINSPLSEFAVMGFDYGYSLDAPYTLVLWEGQFGDFANGAQVIIDQFISSAETKWLRSSGLVLLLPHGYEGQGPEHSSARIERYLQLCAEDNIQVVNCTSPANYFHVLRRQLHRAFRKPLIVFTPKSLLRHKMAVSKLSDFEGKFCAVIGEVGKVDNVRKVIICSGKIYYDLYDARNVNNINDIALIRLEQYYPFPEAKLTEELKKYPNAKVIWCQEEPVNMGGWHFINSYIEKILVDMRSYYNRPECIARPLAASPASGYMNVHLKQQQDIISKALS